MRGVYVFLLLVCIHSAWATTEPPPTVTCAQLVLPGRMRGWQSRLIPASRGHLLSALHARLQEILPADFAKRLTSAARPDSAYDGKLTIGVFREALILLREILTMTEEQYGPDSYETGLVHYSLALFYSVATAKESAITGQSRELWRSEYEYGEFDRLGLQHARRALRLLIAHPAEITVRLHLIKQLVSATRALANTSKFTTDWYPLPPHESFEEHRAEAERELRTLLDSLDDADLSPRAKRWVFLVAHYQHLELEKTVALVKKRMASRRLELFDTLDPARQNEFRLKYEELLAGALADRTMLPALMQEGESGVLFGLINAWRWSAYELSLNLGFAHKRDNRIIHALERKLAAGGASVDDLLRDLAAAGLTIPAPAE